MDSKTNTVKWTTSTHGVSKLCRFGAKFQNFENLFWRRSDGSVFFVAAVWKQTTRRDQAKMAEYLASIFGTEKDK